METMREMIIRKVGQAYHISIDKLLSNKSYIYRRPNSIINEEGEEEKEEEDEGKEEEMRKLRESERLR